MNKNVLITGGLGYIGSHLAYQLLVNGYQVIIIDRDIQKKIKNYNILNQFPLFHCIEGDLLFLNINAICYTYHIDTIIHCAGRKNFIEAFSQPHLYIQDNINITQNIINYTKNNIHIKNFIFISTCMVYQNNLDMIDKENLNLSPTHPYALSKFMEESILKEQLKELNLCILRCFNPIGCHHLVGLGEDVNQSSTISSAIIKSMLSEDKIFNIYGNQFNTIDGTPMRDYFDINSIFDFIKIWFEYINLQSKSFEIFNIGSGHGTTVIQLLETFEKYGKNHLIRNYIEQRCAESTHIVANINKALSIGWKPNSNIDNACLSVLKFNEVI